MTGKEVKRGMIIISPLGTPCKVVQKYSNDMVTIMLDGKILVVTGRMLREWKKE